MAHQLALAEAGVGRHQLEASITRGTLLQDFGAELSEPMRKASPTRSIGGGLDLTTVTAQGVEVVPLRRWPQDEVGKAINPFASKQNRKGRRAMRTA